jgi:hypothetical protein
MGTANWNKKLPFLAGEDLNTTGHIGVAIALDDGKVANDGMEAAGVLATKPKSGEYGSLIFLGVAKARAGGALTAGGRVTVSTSGYFTACASGDYEVGFAIEAVTSGSLGPVLFGVTRPYQQTSN